MEKDQESWSFESALSVGDIDLKGQFMLGSNYTFLVNVHYQGHNYPAVYKPLKGEQPLWDFPENSLGHREVAAYLVSQALGWDFVPFTVLRDDGPFGLGSLQRFIEYDPGYHYFNFSQEDKSRLQPAHKGIRFLRVRPRKRSSGRFAGSSARSLPTGRPRGGYR